jgi:hypothetical protein
LMSAAQAPPTWPAISVGGPARRIARSEARLG